MVQGKLLLEDFSTTKISVLNKNSNETVETDWRGLFKMQMKTNDTLVFYHNDIVFDEYVVPVAVIESKSLRYFLKKTGTQLEELVIDKGPLFDFGNKKLSESEKAELPNKIGLVQNNSVGISTDGVFNRISGRNKIIKKMISMEEVEKRFVDFKNIYSDNVLIDEFDVPKDYINVFVYFLVEQKDFEPLEVGFTERFKIYLLQTVKDFKNQFDCCD